MDDKVTSYNLLYFIDFLKKFFKHFYLAVISNLENIQV